MLDVDGMIAAMEEFKSQYGRPPTQLRMHRKTRDKLQEMFLGQLVKLDSNLNEIAKFRGVPIHIDPTIKYGTIRMCLDIAIG